MFPLIKHWSTKRFYVSRTVYTSFPHNRFFKNDIVIHNPVDHQGILKQLNEAQCSSVREEFNLENQFIVVSVGRLVPQKNHALLLRIFKRFVNYVTDTKLLIVGQGELRAAIQDQIVKYKLQQHVICTGFRRDVIAIIKVADVVLNPSYWEGFSITMLESMVLGTPFIGSKILPFEEAIISGENGFLVEGDDPEAYAKILYRLYQENELRESIAAAAKRTVKKYDAEYVAKQYERYYSL
jgi:glycosyltransferase involved in cell wall biosynthesis